MTRLEEIKETLGHAKTVGLMYDEGEGYARDVDYLLSRLEIAEKALEKISTYPNTEMQSPEDLGYTYQDIADQALQQIRACAIDSTE